MRYKSQFAVAFVGVILVLGFQNCSNTASFSAVGELVAKSGPGETDVEGILEDGPINIGDGAPVVPTTPPRPGQPGRTPDNTEDCDDKAPHSGGGGSNHVQAAQNTLKYVCVLQGPGHSVKVGFSEGTLSGQVGTPRDVCMTENACLNIISTKFEVKAVKQTGFCTQKSPQVVPMTDAQISAALAQADLLKEIAISQRLNR